MIAYYIAQVNDLGLDANSNAAKDIIQQNEALGREIQLATQQTWVQVLQGPLFVAICNVAAIFFGLSFLVLMFIWMRKALHPKGDLASVTIEKIVAVALIAIVIGTPVNRGKLLGAVVLQSHYVQDGIANSVVSNLSSDVQGDVIAQGNAKQEIESTFPQEVEKCLGVDDLKKRDYCLLREDDKVKGQLIDYQNTGWAQSLYERFHKVINDAVSSDSQDKWDPLGDAGKAISNTLGNVGGGISYLVIRGFLLALGSAYLLLLQYAGMLTGLVSPFFISAGLVTDRYEPIVMWAIAYFGIGFAGMLYKVVLGLVSLTILNSPPSDPLVMPMLLSIGAIFLSIVLTRAGGIAIISGVGSFVSGRR